MFLLGACASVAVQTAASTGEGDRADEADRADEIEAPPPKPAKLTATVVGLDAAPSALAPNGKAQITHLARGYNAYVGHLRMEGGGVVPVHRDFTEEFIHVLEGSGTITIDGAEHPVGPGTTIYMPAEAEVSYKNGPDPMVAIQVFAGPEPAVKYDAWQAQ